MGERGIVLLWYNGAMEKQSRLSFITGILYIAGAVLGLLISAGGLAGLWAVRAGVERELTETVGLFGRALDAAGQTAAAIDSALVRAGQNLAEGRAMLTGTARSLGDSQELIDATAGLVGTDLAGVFTQTQDSLAAVESSAQTVDQALGVIEGIRDALGGLRSVLPLFAPPADEKDLPRATLQQSVAEVRRSLEPVPASLGEIERQLSVTAANAALVQADLERLAGKVEEIETGVKDARRVAAVYTGILDDFQKRFDLLEARLPLILRAVYLGLTLVLVWIFINQAAMLAHGIALVRGQNG